MSENNSGKQEDSLNFFEYLVAVLKHKDAIIKGTLAAMGVALLASFVIPPAYLAETKILPPTTSGASMSSAIAAQMGAMGMSPSGLGIKNTSDLYISLLKTRSVADYVIDKLDLMKTFGVKSRSAARDILGGKLVVRDEKKSGIITVGIQYRDPKMAAQIANAYVEGLQNLNGSLAVTEAAQRRLFFETQLKNAKEALVRSEENLKEFQRRTGTIKIDDEAKAVIGAVSDIRAKISAKEVQLRVMRSYATDENPDYQSLKEEVAALKGELNRFESKTKTEDDTAWNVGSMSSMGTEYLRRMREFKYNESLYEILLKQYGSAKLEESRDISIIQVVEYAELPTQKLKPQRKKIVLNTGVLVAFFSLLLVLGKHQLSKLRISSGNQAQLSELRGLFDFSALISDLKIDYVISKMLRVYSRLKK